MSPHRAEVLVCMASALSLAIDAIDHKPRFLITGASIRETLLN